MPLDTAATVVGDLVFSECRQEAGSRPTLAARAAHISLMAGKRSSLSKSSMHRTLKEIERYTAAADQATLSKAAMDKLKGNKKQT